MKRLFTITLLVIVSALVTPLVASAQWNTIGVYAYNALPGAAEFDGKLWIFFQRALDRQIGYVTTTNIDGGVFSAETIITTGAVNPQPAAVVFNNRLYLFYADGGSPYRLFYRSIGTTGTWTLEQQVPGITTQQRPGLAVFNNQLFIVCDPAGNDNRIKYVTMSTIESFSGVQTPFGLTTRAPAVAVYNNRLYVVYTGEYGPPWNLYYVWMDSNGNWSSHYAVSGNAKSWAPISAAAPFRGLLQIYYTGASTYHLLTKNLNTSGAWSTEGWLLGLSAYYGTSAANFNIRQWVFTYGNQSNIWYIVLR